MACQAEELLVMTLPNTASESAPHKITVIYFICIFVILPIVQVDADSLEEELPSVSCSFSMRRSSACLLKSPAISQAVRGLHTLVAIQAIQHARTLSEALLRTKDAAVGEQDSRCCRRSIDVGITGAAESDMLISCITRNGSQSRLNSFSLTIKRSAALQHLAFCAMQNVPPVTSTSSIVHTGRGSLRVWEMRSSAFRQPRIPFRRHSEIDQSVCCKTTTHFADLRGQLLDCCPDSRLPPLLRAACKHNHPTTPMQSTEHPTGSSFPCTHKSSREDLQSACYAVVLFHGQLHDSAPTIATDVDRAAALLMEEDEDEDEDKEKEEEEKKKKHVRHLQLPWSH
ncbi:hypothetical protein TcWFU_002916 [Taenia crassiceps]|uniref:Uncharacterized protein n=1 Tax=Taenia crassiceps TaxID=6207 RepID=A0ABR4Q7Y3_9CEST